jgi:hypothetical protein
MSIIIEIKIYLNSRANCVVIQKNELSKYFQPRMLFEKVRLAVENWRPQALNLAEMQLL